MFYVYILRSINFQKTYTGITFDLTKRIKAHNSGGSGKYTQRYKPWEIIYSELSENSIQARKREKYLKSSAGRKWIKRNIFSRIGKYCKLGKP
ncbi:MAG: GIY-YIG nuclease family protein [Patescibacteria group bacterium]